MNVRDSDVLAQSLRDDRAMKKIQYLYCTVPCKVSRDDRTIKMMLFHQSAA